MRILPLSMIAAVPLLLGGMSLLPSCGDSGATTTTSTSSGGVMDGCTMPTDVPCSDEVILQMNLKQTLSAGAVSNAPDGDGFTSTIDAVAGGAFNPNPGSYTYAKFATDGLEKVDISDEDSLTSMDWDIAFRRYIVRINSGHSGPSCVKGARVPDQFGAYEAITKEPPGLTYRADLYFTDAPDCSLIPDGSGLPGSPATALSSYWTYPGCVSMSHFPYVLLLADGRRIKLTIDDFYSPAAQNQCDTQHTIPMTNNGSGNFIIRWAEIPK